MDDVAYHLMPQFMDVVTGREESKKFSTDLPVWLQYEPVKFNNRRPRVAVLKLHQLITAI